MRSFLQCEQVARLEVYSLLLAPLRLSRLAFECLRFGFGISSPWFGRFLGLGVSLETRHGPKSLSPTLGVRKVLVHVFPVSAWHPPDCQPSTIAHVVYVLWKVRGRTSRFLVPTDHPSVLSTA